MKVSGQNSSSFIIPKRSSKDGLTSFIAAFVARLNEGSTVKEIKKDLRKGVYHSSDSSAASIIKCRHGTKDGCCVFDATDEAKFLPPIITGTAPSHLCRCCEASTNSNISLLPSIACSALEESTTQTAQDQAHEKSAALVSGKLKTIYKLSSIQIRVSFDAIVAW